MRCVCLRVYKQNEYLSITQSLDILYPCGPSRFHTNTYRPTHNRRAPPEGRHSWPGRPGDRNAPCGPRWEGPGLSAQHRRCSHSQTQSREHRYKYLITKNIAPVPHQARGWIHLARRLPLITQSVSQMYSSRSSNEPTDLLSSTYNGVKSDFVCEPQVMIL